MEKGDTVMIYEDPWTCKKEEGQAKLIQRWDDHGDVEYWEVRFISDGAQVNRFIKKKGGEKQC